MKKTIVTFQVGRGGRYFNGGHTTFYDDCPIGHVHVVSEKLFSPVSHYDDDDCAVEDEDPEAEWTDCDGHEVGLTNAMIESGIGIIDIDGDYESYYSKYLEDCDENELLIILEDGREYLIRQYIEENTDLKFDWKRLKSDKWKDLIEVAFLHPATQSLYLPELLEEEDED